jgi:hypothetical protein
MKKRKCDEIYNYMEIELISKNHPTITTKTPD